MRDSFPVLALVVAHLAAFLLVILTRTQLVHRIEPLKGGLGVP